MKKSVAIIQPNFFPWIGYFEIIKKVDKFIILDDVHYTYKDWRNRNKINLSNKEHWINVPVIKRSTKNLIVNVKIHDDFQADKFLKKITHAYNQSNHFNFAINILKTILEEQNYIYLCDLLNNSLKKICNLLNIKTEIILSSELKLENSIEKNKRLVKICKIVGADTYISGPGGLNYLNPNLFTDNSISLFIVKYKKQIDYIDNNKFKFLENLSIIDLLFHQGSNSYKFLKDVDLRLMN